MTHSILVMKTPPRNDIPDCGEIEYDLDKNGVWKVATDKMEYDGYALVISDRIYDKAMYAIAALCPDFKGEWFEKVREAVQQIYPKCIDIVPDPYMRCPVYIGKENIGMLEGFLDEHNVSLVEFISDSRYVVVIDDRTNRVNRKTKEIGLLNTSAIAYEYPVKAKEEN